jgi:hypothetical protein
MAHAETSMITASVDPREAEARKRSAALIDHPMTAFDRRARSFFHLAGNGTKCA